MTEQNLFSMICKNNNGHNYIKAENDSERSGYYKEDKDGNRDHRKVYRMIFCTQCGDNKEILVVDRTQSKVITETKKKKGGKKK